MGGSTVSQGISKGFDKINYGEALLDGAIAVVSFGTAKLLGPVVKKFASKAVSKLSDTFSGITNQAKSTFSKVTDKVKSAFTKGTGKTYTKSNMKLGREMHKTYKVDMHNPAKGLYKEYTGIKGIRPDFVDFNTKTNMNLNRLILKQ